MTAEIVQIAQLVFDKPARFGRHYILSCRKIYFCLIQAEFAPFTEFPDQSCYNKNYPTAHDNTRKVDGDIPWAGGSADRCKLLQFVYDCGDKTDSKRYYVRSFQRKRISHSIKSGAENGKY